MNASTTSKSSYSPFATKPGGAKQEKNPFEPSPFQPAATNPGDVSSDSSIDAKPASHKLGANDSARSSAGQFAATRKNDNATSTQHAVSPFSTSISEQHASPSEKPTIGNSPTRVSYSEQKSSNLSNEVSNGE